MSENNDCVDIWPSCLSGPRALVLDMMLNSG